MPSGINIYIYKYINKWCWWVNTLQIWNQTWCKQNQKRFLSLPMFELRSQEQTTDSLAKSALSTPPTDSPFIQIGSHCDNIFWCLNQFPSDKSYLSIIDKIVWWSSWKMKENFFLFVCQNSKFEKQQNIWKIVEMKCLNSFYRVQKQHLLKQVSWLR
jgi:hypothetical protein